MECQISIYAFKYRCVALCTLKAAKYFTRYITILHYSQYYTSLQYSCFVFQT